MARAQHPQLVVQLAGQQTSGAAGAGSGGAWLQLSPDTMHQHRLTSQQIMLVGLCHPPELPAAAAAAAFTSPGRQQRPAYPGSSSMSSPGPSAITPSKFAPSAVALQPEQVQLVDLWLRAGLLEANGRGQQQQQLPGRFMLPVSLWPCAKLPRGVALISSSAWSALVQPEQGAYLALYTINQAAAAAAVAVQPAKQLSVDLCTDPQHHLLLTPQHIQHTAARTSTAAAAGSASPSLSQAAAAAAAAAGFTTPTRKPPSTPASKSSASSSSKKQVKSSSKGSKQQQQQQQQQDGGSASGPTAAAAAQWQLQLLQDGLDWSKPRQRQLMQQLVHKHLLGCAFLSGNVMYVPVLGARVLCLLQPTVDTPQQQQQQEVGVPIQQQQQQQVMSGVQPPLTLQQPPLLITSATQMLLQAPNEQQPGLPSLQAVLGLQAAAGAEAAAVAAVAAAGGSSGVSVSLQQRVSAGREAAAAAVDGSAQEAAMEAAERAVRAGAAAVSVGGGYSRLGGIQQYVAALRELVMLPLQMPQLFARFKLRPPRGVLLHGPPGSGKTALARAAALESGATLLVVNGPDVLTEFYGESEAGLSGIFAAAAALSPSIVFIDEIDAIAPSRDAAGHGGASSHTAAAGGGRGSSAAGEAAARVLTQLLVLMDGLGSSAAAAGSSGSSVAAAGSSGSSSAVAAGSSAVAAGSSGSSAAAAGSSGSSVAAAGSSGSSSAVAAGSSAVAAGSSGSSAAAAGSSGSSAVAAGSSSTGAGVKAATDAPVVVIAATNRPAAVDPALRRPGRFEREIEVGVPDPAAREHILTVRLSSVKHELTSQQIHQLAQHSQGFVGADLAALVNEAALAALRRHVTALQQQQQQQPRDASGSSSDMDGKQQLQVQRGREQQQQQQGVGLCVCWRDFEAARLLVRPSALREVAVEVPQVSWSDVGGLGDVKQRLQEAVLWPQTHADALERLGATAPKGVLLYGPPGCSKTLLARAVAATSGLNFLSVKGGELYSSYVGESERAVAALFARARAAAPAVVFFDELDGLVSSRGDTGAGAGIGERVLAQLLTEMDGLQARLGVVVLAATNRPDKVDPALLRPGRFDRLLLVPPPDAAARQEIFKVHTRKTPLSSDVDLAALAVKTDGYTGADISAVCREAAMAALEQDLESAAVSAHNFDVALGRVKPSSPADSASMACYQQFQQHGQSGAADAWQPAGEVKFVV